MWRAITDPESIAAWLMRNDFAPVVGHRFRFHTEPRPGFDGVVHCEVLEVDEPRKRISLTLRLEDEPAAGAKPDRGDRGAPRREPGRGEQGRADKGRGGQGKDDKGQGRSGQGRGGQGGDRREGRAGQPNRGADRGRASAPAANNAMADALRRAGFDVGGKKG